MKGGTVKTKRYVIYLSASSCSGKSTLIGVMGEERPDLYHVSYDKLKWQLAGYHRDSHKTLIKGLSFDLFKAVCQRHIPLVLLDFFIENRAEYLYIKKIAKKHGYNFLTVKLVTPRKVLLSRFKKRVANAKRIGSNISVTDTRLFLKNLAKKSYAPTTALIFDTSKSNVNSISKKIIKKLTS